MDTIQLSRILNTDPFVRKRFGKVCARDQLPKRALRRSYVINTDVIKNPGQHWVCVYFDIQDDGCVIGEYFDSYGRYPCIEIERFLSDNCTRWIYSEDVLQGLFTKLCGHYCIYYLYHRHRSIQPLHIHDRKLRIWYQRTIGDTQPLTLGQRCECRGIKPFHVKNSDGTSLILTDSMLR